MISHMKAPHPTRAAEPAPTLSPRQKQKQQTRAALLEAAKAVVQRRGFTSTTSRDIAREAGVSVGTVFLHFPEVSGLAEALLDERIGAALEKAYRSLPKRGDLVDRLLHVFAHLFESYDVDRELSRDTLAASLFRADPEGPGAARLAQFQRWVAGEVDAAISTRRVPALDLTLAFSAVFSLYFGALIAGLRGQLDRKGQLAMLEAALRRFFTLEARR